MLTMNAVAELEKRYRTTRVLSVYVNSTLSDPAVARAPLSILRKGISDARARLASRSRSERLAFEAAVERALASVPAADEIHAGKGWIGLFLPDAEILNTHLTFAVPDVVAWEDGIRVAPLILSLEQAATVEIVLADSRGARLLRYSEAGVERVENIKVETHAGPVYHMGNAPRTGFHVGTHGAVGADEAERVYRAAATRMYAEVTSRFNHLADTDRWLLIGGTREACSELERLLTERARTHAIRDESLHMRSSLAQIAVAAERAASRLRENRDAAIVADIASLSRSGGKGAVGMMQALIALEAGAVRELLFTTRLLHEYPDVTEKLVRLAMLGGAAVHHSSGAAAATLDENFDGVAARLRFVPGAASAAS